MRRRIGAQKTVERERERGPKWFRKLNRRPSSSSFEKGLEKEGKLAKGDMALEGLTRFFKVLHNFSLSLFRDHHLAYNR